MILNVYLASLIKASYISTYRLSYFEVFVFCNFLELTVLNQFDPDS